VAGVVRERDVFFVAEGFVAGGGREDEEEGVGGPWDEGEEVRVGDAVDVVELECGREAEVVEERGHYFGVVLCGFGDGLVEWFVMRMMILLLHRWAIRTKCQGTRHIPSGT
jgi:hypothetical protein